MARRYAQNTNISYHRSREQIAKLLEEWGATGVQWTDEWTPKPKFTCKFVWSYETEEKNYEHQLAARFALAMDEEVINSRSIDGRSGEISENKLAKNKTAWINESHRLLLIFLKAAFNAIEAGLITAEQIFMPFLEHESGHTLGEMFSGKLNLLPHSNFSKMIGAGAGDGK